MKWTVQTPAICFTIVCKLFTIVCVSYSSKIKRIGSSNYYRNWFSVRFQYVRNLIQFFSSSDFFALQNILLLMKFWHHFTMVVKVWPQIEFPCCNHGMTHMPRSLRSFELSANRQKQSSYRGIVHRVSRPLC